jgi:uncharacterized membrane protein
MRLFALAALSGLALAACSNEPAQPGEPSAPAEPPAVVGGVDLSSPVRLVGNEPFWSIDLTGEALVYKGVDRPEQRAPQPRPVVQGTVATYEATTGQGTAIRIMLTATECSDGMSDRTYPLTAMVEVGSERLNGCAASTSAIMNAGESGPVVDPAPAADPSA